MCNGGSATLEATAHSLSQARPPVRQSETMHFDDILALSQRFMRVEYLQLVTTAPWTQSVHYAF